VFIVSRISRLGEKLTWIGTEVAEGGIGLCVAVKHDLVRVIRSVLEFASKRRQSYSHSCVRLVILISIARRVSS
jgi:hypothetical protein